MNRSLIAALLGSLAVPARAAPPPPALGKSIAISWNENHVQRGVGQSNFREVDTRQSLDVHVGPDGRVTSRFNVTNRLGSGTTNRSPAISPQPESRFPLDAR